MYSYFRLLLCVQVEACWAWPQLNRAQMASGHSPRFPAILVVFCCFLNLGHPLYLKNNNKKTDINASGALRDEMQLWPCSLMPFWMCFPSSLLRSCDWHGLLSFWWQPAGDLLCRWNGQLFDFYLSFVRVRVRVFLWVALPRSSRALLLLAGSRSASVIRSLPPLSTLSSDAGVGAGRNLLSAGLCFQTRQLGLPEGPV